MSSILVVEDEASIADTIVYALRAEGFEVVWVPIARAALEHLRTNPVALVILDVGLPDMSGFELCKSLRRFAETPVIFLTARGEEIDRVVGLEIGADDYVVKPFSPRELVARVKAILKRAAVNAVSANTASINTASLSSVSSESSFCIDEQGLQITCGAVPLNLTKHEFLLLKCLLEQPGRVFSREQLLRVVGVSADANYERSIDTHVKGLRAKLRLVLPNGEPIQTHRGFGYSYNPDA